MVWSRASKLDLKVGNWMELLGNRKLKLYPSSFLWKFIKVMKYSIEAILFPYRHSTYRQDRGVDLDRVTTVQLVTLQLVTLQLVTLQIVTLQLVMLQFVTLQLVTLQLVTLDVMTSVGRREDVETNLDETIEGDKMTSDKTIQRMPQWRLQGKSLREGDLYCNQEQNLLNRNPREQNLSAGVS